MTVLLAAITMLIPLVITPGLLLYFDLTPKVAILLLGAAAGAVLTAPWRSRLGSVVNGPRIVRWFGILLAMQAISLVIGTFWSTNRELSLIGTNWRRFGLLTNLAVLAFAWMAVQARWRVLLRAMVAAGIPAAAYGISQYFGWDPWLPAAGYVVGEGEWSIVRPPSTLGYASYAGTFYLFSVFVGIAVARADPERVWRAPGILAAATGSLATIMSGTRAAILGLLAGAVVLAIAERPRVTTRRIAFAALVLVACGVFYISPGGERLRARVRWSVEDSRGGGRLLLWRDSLRMAALRPATGWGLEVFSTEFPPLESRELAKAYPDFYYESPHNIFLDAFVSAGALGLLSLVGLTGLAAYAAWTARKTAPLEAAGLAAAIVAAVVAQQFTVFVVPTALYTYLAMALLVSMAAGKVPVAAPRNRAVAGTMLLLAGVWVWLAIRLVTADFLLARTRDALDGGDVTRAVALYNRSLPWQTPGTTSDLWYSRALANAAQSSTNTGAARVALQEGYAAALRATERAEDRHHAFYNLATYCALRNDFACLERSLRRTIDYAPNWFKPHWMLAKALLLVGRSSEAEAEAKLAVALNNARDPEVERTLDEVRSRPSRRDSGRNK